MVNPSGLWKSTLFLPLRGLHRRHRGIHCELDVMSLTPGYNVPKQCLVTGGSGFVGQRLVEMLIG